MSEMNVISVVKYKVKDGFENEFVEALKRLAFNLIHILPRRRSSNIRQE